MYNDVSHINLHNFFQISACPKFALGLDKFRWPSFPAGMSFSASMPFAANLEFFLKRNTPVIARQFCSCVLCLFFVGTRQRRNMCLDGISKHPEDWWNGGEAGGT